MSESPRIGIWGPSGSGKTTYLGALYLEMLKEWTIRDESSIGLDSSYLAFEISNALTAGNFPKATPRQSKHYALYFRPIKDGFGARWRQSPFALSLYEAPGEFTGRDSGLLETDEVGKYYFNLSECMGLMLMIDPVSNHQRGEDLFGVESGTYYLALQKLFRNLQSDSSEKIFPKLAFCLMKTDIDSVQARLSKASVEDVIYEIIGADARNLLRSRCVLPQRVKFYAISSVGSYQIEGTERPNVTYSPRENSYQIAKPQERKPINITAPLYWLLGR
jgi:hypothetical protein